MPSLMLSMIQVGASMVASRSSIASCEVMPTSIAIRFPNAVLRSFRFRQEARYLGIELILKEKSSLASYGRTDQLACQTRKRRGLIILENRGWLG
jgi:hypothetical protein